MLSGLVKQVDLAGSVIFRGTLPLRLEEFAEGQLPGVRTTPLPDVEGWRWGLRLEHVEWGTADLACLKEDIFPPRELLELDPRLTPADVVAIAASKTQLSLRMRTPRASQLRTRKHFLRFLRAVMGPEGEGVAAVDHVSQRIWPRESLDDELMHDADLDVDALFTIHDVQDEPESENGDSASLWMHTHGLGELDFFDFDILRMHPENRVTVADLTRATAFAIIEGRAKAGQEHELASPAGHVRLVDARAFMKRAAAVDSASREDPHSDHAERRVVLCDRVRRSWYSLRAPRPRPARWLQRPGADQQVYAFSREAGALMAERARVTYRLMRELHQEFADLELPALVKLRYRVDGGGEDDQEHLWFEVRRCYDDRIDAVLENEPFRIARLKRGDRGDHPLELLSDWTIFTPAGSITPRDFAAARRLRARHDEVRELLEQLKQQSTQG